MTGIGARRRGSLNRGLILTLLVSLGLHLAALAAVLLLPRGGVPIADAPEKPAEVELVMEEHKGDPGPTTAPPPAPRQPAEPPKSDAKNASPAARLTDSPVSGDQPEAPPDTQAPVPAPAAKADPAETSQQAQAAPPEPKPSPPAAEPALTVKLSGTDSPSDARAWGDHVVPAAPDAVFHNRPPEDPDEAARKGEHGTVVLLIHVSPAGRTAGVDVMRSSGSVLLDRAASEAVARWRFLPAVKDGQPVASDMTMGFIFDF